MGAHLTLTGFSAARFSGPCWVVVMDDDLWDRFRTAVPTAANERMTIKLEHLAAFGETDMPRPRLRWEQDAADPGGAIAYIEARGTVLRGTVSTVDGRRHLFVRSIAVDPAEERPTTGRRRGRPPDERQGRLKLRDED